MTCSKCGYQLFEGDQFCKRCGERIGNEVEIKQQANVGQDSVNSAVGSRQLNNEQINPIYQEFGVPNQTVNNQVNGQPVYNQSVQQQPQQPMNQQPVYNNQQYGYNTNAQPKSKAMPIIIGMIAVAIIGALIFFIFKGMNNKEGGESAVVNNDYSINFKGFSFKIPTSLIYEIDADSLGLTNVEETWAASIEVVGGTNFSKIIANKNQIKANFDDMGFTTNNLIEKTYSGVNYLTLELSKGGMNYVLGMTNANSMSVFSVNTIVENNDFDYSVIKTVAPILKSAKYLGESANIKTNPNINVNSAINNLTE